MHDCNSPTKRTEPQGGGSLSCSLCPQKFKYPAALKKHMLNHSESKEFLCRICNSVFETESDVKEHKDSVHTKLSCQLCSATFPTNEEDQLLDHINSMHNGKERENAICADCGSQFKTQNQLKIHNETKCGTIKRFTCNRCDSKFMTQNTLNAHKMIHVGEKKHLCDYCGKRFLSKGQLKVHERSHTLEKPFRCDVCDKAFSYRESLVTHSSLHTGIKPYLCEGCGSRFSCIGNLIKHRKSRPKTCGLPQFCKNTKIAPRASSKVPGSLTIKTYSKTPRLKKNSVEVKSKPPSEPLLQLKEEDCESVKSELILPITTSVIKNTETEQIEMEMETSTQDNNEHHFIIDSDNITVESNIEIEFITSDELMPSEAEAGVSYPHSNKKYEINFIDDIDDQQNEYDDNSWQEETYIKSDESEHHIIYVEQECDEKKPIISEVNNGRDTEHNITILEDVDIVTRFSDQIKQADTEDDLCNITNTMKSEEFQQPESEEPEDTEEYELYDVKYEDDDDDEPQSQELQNVTSTEVYKCNLCPKMYILEGAFNTHLKTEHDVGGIAQVTTRAKKPKKKTKSTKPEVICQYCGKKYTSATLLEKHEKVHGECGTLIYKCSCCSVWFASTIECEKHQNDQHKDKLFCKQCNKMFKEPDNLVAHNRYSHSDVPYSPKKYTFVCPNCGRNFSSKVALSDHERSNCGNAPIYKCKVCQKSYHSAGSLKTHSSVHSGELPHLCKYCGKAFRTQGQVKIHERKHNGIKPFKCEFCDKSFAYRESLLTHLSVHTGLKRFMCQACGSRFSCISNLQAHRKSHKATCGMTPNITKAVGPMGLETVYGKSEASKK